MKKNLEERMNIVKKILFGEPTMLMTKPIKKGSVKNKDICGCCTGFTLDIDNLSYRGTWISTIEGINLYVDGEEIPENVILICINGMKIPVANCSGHTEVFWDPQATCSLSVNKIGGLTPGEHKISIEIIRRPDFGHSYGENYEGYNDAYEFLNPEHIKDEILFTI